jgi:hypothetical protein
VITFCALAHDNQIGPGWPRLCADGAGLIHQDEYVQRDYCDRCIMTGIKITKKQGLIDPDVYAQSMGVSIVALMRCNPEWRP